MNIRNVLTVYTKLRNFTDDESALLETLRAMNDSERELLVEALQPEGATATATTPRKIEHCDADGCGLTRRARVHKDVTADGYHEFQLSEGKPKKSKRATGMATTISNSLTQRRRIPLCTHVSEDGDDPTECGEAETSGIHDATMGYRNYHPFQPPASTAERASSASTALSAQGNGTQRSAQPLTRESADDQGQSVLSSGQSSGMQPEGVSSAHREASGGT